MWALTKRHLKLFFRDKSAVFFSILSSLLMIGIYFLFLGDNLTSQFSGLSDARDIMDNWLIAGLLAITSLTTSLSVFGIKIDDNLNGINKDFYSAPVSKAAIAGSYIASAFLISLIITAITFMLGEIFVFFRGGVVMNFKELLLIFIVVLIADFTNSALMFFITSLFESHAAFAAASSTIGMLIGFVTGIYIPIGFLPNWVQWLIKLFPTSHAASLLRQIMMTRPIEENLGATASPIVDRLSETMGMTYHFGEYTVSNTVSILTLIIVGMICYGLGVWSLSRKQKN